MPASWSKYEPKPLGRQDHWLDRISAIEDDEPEGTYIPNKVVKTIKLKAPSCASRSSS